MTKTRSQPVKSSSVVASSSDTVAVVVAAVADGSKIDDGGSDSDLEIISVTQRACPPVDKCIKSEPMLKSGTLISFRLHFLLIF